MIAIEGPIKMGKHSIKGQLNTIVISILLMVFLVGAIFVVWKIYGMIKTNEAKQICKDSLLVSGIKLNGLMDKFGNPVEIKCNTEYVNIGAKDDAEIEKAVADKMVECWDLYGKGEKEIFNTKDNTYCVACTRLTFDKQTEIPHFSAFLNSNMAPLKKDTYLNYLSGLSIDNFQTTEYENSELGQHDNLSTKEPLAVMFVMGKNANPDAKLGLEEGKPYTTMVGAGVGVGAGILGGLVVGGLIACPETLGVGCVVAGLGTIVSAVIASGVVAGAEYGAVGYMVGASRSADWDAKIVLWPYDKISELPCTYMEGKAGHLEIQQQ